MPEELQITVPEPAPMTAKDKARRDGFIRAALTGLTPAFIESIHRSKEPDFAEALNTAAKTAVALADIVIQETK